MPDLTDTAANREGAFVFQTDSTTPQQVVNALDDFTTFLDLFEVRSREYGDGAAFFLGSKGQFSDIYRKIIKLKTALWDGKPEQLTSEGTEEVIYDLIGHLFLTLQCLRLENRKTVVNPAFAPRGAEPRWYMEEDTPAAPQYFDGETKPDPREWLYDKGDKVKMDDLNGGSWLSGQTGTIVRRSVEDGGLWYTVDFSYPNAKEITVSQDRLSIVSRSQEWWGKQKGDDMSEVEPAVVPEWQKGIELKGRGEPTLIADFERVAPRKIKDSPQA